MREHTHVCHSKYHEGQRTRKHYSDSCTEPRDSNCTPCEDDEFAAVGATWQYHDSIGTMSDADPGL